MGGFLEQSRDRHAKQTCSTGPTTTHIWAQGAPEWLPTTRNADSSAKSTVSKVHISAPSLNASCLSLKRNSGIGVISDTDPQPIIFNSHLGKFAIVTVAKIANIDELEKRMLAANHHFAELSSGKINQTELVALLITEGRDFVEAH